MNELYNEGNTYPEMDAEVTRLNEEISSTTNTIERLRRETLANVLSFRRKNIEASINNVDIRLNDRTSELYNEENAYPEMDTTIQNLNAELSGLRSNLDNLNRYTEANNLISNLDNYESNLKNLQEQLDARMNELYNEGNAYPETDSKVVDLNNQISSINSTIDKLKQDTLQNALMIEIEQREEHLSDIQGQLDARMNELYNEGNAYPEMDNEVIRLRDEVSTYNRNISNLKELLNQGHLTENILNEITLPDMNVNINTNQIENTNFIENEQNEEIASQTQGNEKTIEDIINDKEAELRA